MKKLRNWFEYNEKKKSNIDLEENEKEKDDEISVMKEKKPEKKIKDELTNHDKMWNSVEENINGIISTIKDKNSEEVVSVLKNKIADGKLKFKDIKAIKKTAKALHELMK